MRYSIPKIDSFPKIHFVAESQYNVIVGIDPSDGCPDLVLDNSTLTGTASVSMTYSLSLNFSSQNTCEGTLSVSGQVTVENGVVIAECTNLEQSCNFFCQETSQPLGGEICITSFILNGEAQDVDGACFTVDGVAAAILYNNGPCD